MNLTALPLGVLTPPEQLARLRAAIPAERLYVVRWYLDDGCAPWPPRFLEGSLVRLATRVALEGQLTPCCCATGVVEPLLTATHLTAYLDGRPAGPFELGWVAQGVFLPLVDVTPVARPEWDVAR